MMIVYEVYDEDRGWEADYKYLTLDTNNCRSVIYQTDEEFPYFPIGNSPSNSYRMF